MARTDSGTPPAFRALRCLTLSLGLSVLMAAGQLFAFQDAPDSASDKFWDNSDFSGLDLTDFEAVLRVRRPQEEPSNLSALARRNLQYVFFNRLNRNRFLVPPSPQDVVARVLSLLRLNEEITVSINTGKSLVAPEAGNRPQGQERALIRQIEETTKRLHQQFADFFLEPREATYSFRVPTVRDRSGFLHFVRQADHINQRLTEEMNDYFLAESPGSIHLNDYRKVTINVLTESLVRLCKLSRQGLR